jgi:hypothetical protein
MTWELYEVWTVDEDGHEDLLDTTKDIKEARRIAHKALEDFTSAIIYRDSDGDLEFVEEVTIDDK